MQSSLPSHRLQPSTGNSPFKGLVKRYGLLILFLIGLFGWATAVPLYGSVSLAWAAERQVSYGSLPLWALTANVISSVLLGILMDRDSVWAQRGARLAPIVAAAATLGLRLLPPSTWPALFALMGLAMGTTATWGRWFTLHVDPRHLGRVFALAGAGVSLVNWLFGVIDRHITPSIGLLLTLLPLLLAWIGASRQAEEPEQIEQRPVEVLHLRVRLRTAARIGAFIIFFSMVAGLSYRYLIITPVTPFVDETLRRLPYIACILIAGVLADRRNLLTVMSIGAGLLALAFLVGAWAVPALQYLSLGLNGAAFGLLESAPWLLLASLAGGRSAGRWFGWGLNLNIVPIMIGAVVALPLGALTPEHLGLIAAVAIVLATLALQGASDPLAILHNSLAGPATLPAVAALPPEEEPVQPAGPQLNASDRLGDRYGHLLSARELEIGRLAILGMTTRDIAQQLFLSENTIKTHLKNLFRKTETANRNELYRKLMESEEST